jgi:hypothetical protein
MSIFSRKHKDDQGYNIRKSRLSQLNGEEYMREAERIVQEYGGVIADAMSQVKTKYRAMVFPASLLPASKADIQEAFEIFLEPKSFDLSEEQRSSMNTIYMMLDRFIDDEDAKAKNQEYIDKLKESK